MKAVHHACGHAHRVIMQLAAFVGERHHDDTLVFFRALAHDVPGGFELFQQRRERR